jgi:tRNA pseudouridine38-40 synthase
MRNLRLILQFDGTDFSGWQYQDNARSVQGDLAKALKTLTGEHVILHSSSRTDSGVHAMAMPVSFRLDTTLPLKAFVLGLNSKLPHDLRVLSAVDMDLDFNARFSAIGKTYVYRVQCGRVALPMERRTAWHVPVPLRLDLMREAALLLPGEHDFSAFRSSQCSAASPVRTLRSVTVVEERPGIIAIEVEGGGFLRNMVRIIAGTLVDVGRCNHPPSWITELLKHGDRQQGGMTAPGKGLFLKEVQYP